MRLLLAGLLLNSLLLSPTPASDGSPAAIPDSPKGFDQQFRDFFDSFKEGTDQNIKLKLEEFAIPSHWFTDGFGADKGPEVAKEYSQEFEYFKLSTLLKLRRMEGNQYCSPSRAKLRTRRDQTIKVELKLLASPPAFQIPPAQSFQIYSGDCSWMDTFIHVDGAFRFYGIGAHTFWDPVKVRRADPCGPNDGTQPNGRLIHRVEPEYPEEARQKHVKGFVKMVVTVAEDGSVKKVKIVEGKPMLTDAAIKAAMQWRYSPFMNCGKPVEMQSFEHVKFPPSS
jgi:TonB family protein